MDMMDFCVLGLWQATRVEGIGKKLVMENDTPISGVAQMRHGSGYGHGTLMDRLIVQNNTI